MGKRVSEMSAGEHAIALVSDSARRKNPVRAEYLLERRRQERLAEPERTSRQLKDYHLRSYYGVTLAEYEATLEEQGGCCAVCAVRLEGMGATKACLDHRHVDGYSKLPRAEKKALARGILCHSCNVAVGHLDDSPKLLDAAKNYLMPQGSDDHLLSLIYSTP